MLTHGEPVMFIFRYTTGSNANVGKRAGLSSRPTRPYLKQISAVDASCILLRKQYSTEVNIFALTVRRL